MTEPRLLILNGPKFNHSSLREAIVSTSDIERQCAKACAEQELKMDFRQTDDIEQLLDWISESEAEANALIINPGSYHQASGRLADALDKFAQRNKSITEVHLDNIFNQQQQAIRPLDITQGKTGFISGLGISGYLLAINTIASSVKAVT